MLNITPEMVEHLTPAMIVVTPELIERFSLHVQEFNQTYNTLHCHLNYFQHFIETKINVIYTEQHDKV
jgi:hypothetical protein